MNIKKEKSPLETMFFYRDKQDFQNELFQESLRLLQAVTWQTEIVKPKISKATTTKPEKEKGFDLSVLKSYTPKRLPCNGQYLIRNGRIVATDLCTTISIPTKEKDGVYQFAGKNLIASKFDHEGIPVIDRQGEKEIGKVPRKEFTKLFEQAEAASFEADNGRDFLSGVHLVSANGKLKLVATDGHRLHVRSMPFECRPQPFAEEISMIVPNTILKALKAMRGESLTIFTSELNTITFEGENCWVKSRLIQEKFPDYEKIIPKKYNKSEVYNRVELIDTLKQLIPFRNPKSHAVEIFNGIFKAENIEKQITKTLKLIPEKREIKIAEKINILMPLRAVGKLGCDIRYAIDCLETLETEKVSVLTGQKLHPIGFCEVN